MLLTVGPRSVAIQLQIEHTDLLARYNSAGYASHYQFFSQRVLALSPAAFDAKFETLLLFLVEAIGIPVLLSLLLLTYSVTLTLTPTPTLTPTLTPTPTPTLFVLLSLLLTYTRSHTRTQPHHPCAPPLPPPCAHHPWSPTLHMAGDGRLGRVGA
jgi:hypothetical protein